MKNSKNIDFVRNHKKEKFSDQIAKIQRDINELYNGDIFGMESIVSDKAKSSIKDAFKKLDEASEEVKNHEI